jgi:hypothetical protein
MYRADIWFIPVMVDYCDGIFETSRPNPMFEANGLTPLYLGLDYELALHSAVAHSAEVAALE